MNQRTDREPVAPDPVLDRLLHDLLGETSTLLLWQDVLRQSTQSQHKDAALSAIQQSATMQGRMIQDYRDMLHARRGTLALEERRIDLDELLVAAIERACTTSNVELGASVAHAAVVGDHERLAQTLDRMLEHATALAAPGTVVRVELAREGKDLVLTIRPRQPRTDRLAIPSVGIALARELIASHGGELVLDEATLAVEARLPGR